MCSAMSPKSKPALRLEWWEPVRLREHPENWRLHDEEQEAPLRAALDEVGWAGALLYNERTKRLIDGHLRQRVADRGEKVPVLVGDWDEEQERLILVALDPLAELAGTDAEALHRLLRQVRPEHEALDALLVGLRARHPLPTIPGESAALAGLVEP